jgi:hypothetical protein
MNPKALDDTHCAQCCQDAQFHPNKGRNFQHSQPKDHNVRETLDYKKHLSLQVGQYCQVHKEDTLCNSQSPRTKGAILLGPSGGNLPGRYKFMALNIRNKITH